MGVMTVHAGRCSMIMVIFPTGQAVMIMCNGSKSWGRRMVWAKWAKCGRNRGRRAPVRAQSVGCKLSLKAGGFGRKDLLRTTSGRGAQTQLTEGSGVGMNENRQQGSV